MKVRTSSEAAEDSSIVSPERWTVWHSSLPSQSIDQVMQNLPRVDRGELPESLRRKVDAVNAELDGGGRVLVRPSGTEPVVRVLAEAATQGEAENLCARIASLVTQELG